MLGQAGLLPHGWTAGPRPPRGPRPGRLWQHRKPARGVPIRRNRTATSETASLWLDRRPGHRVRRGRPRPTETRTTFAPAALSLSVAARPRVSSR